MTYHLLENFINKNILQQSSNKKAITIVEVMIVFSIILLLLSAIYRFFIQNIKIIKYNLEQASLNENIRNFLIHLSYDIRKANIVIHPKPIQKEEVIKLLPAKEGLILKLEHQSIDFKIKPPDPKFIKSEIIEYRLMKNKTSGLFELYRDFTSELLSLPNSHLPIRGSKRVCGGIREIKIYTTISKEPKIHNFINLPFKSFIEFTPYYLDGTGSNLIHIAVKFVRENLKVEEINSATFYEIKTSFALRGKLCTPNP